MLPLCLPLLLAACATTSATGTHVEGPARIGQTVYVSGPTVRPLAVIEDSRCPEGVMCIWAGRVILRVEVETGCGRQEMELTLGEPKPVADGQLTLRDVTPARHQSRATAPGDYRFTFDFAGGL